MTVVINEKIAPSVSMDDKGYLSYVRTFEVIFASPAVANPNDALLALPISKGDYYAYGAYTDYTSRALTVTATPDNDSTTYTVTVNYGPTPLETTSVTPTKTWGYNAYSEPLISDLDNNAVVNSAGDPIYKIEAERFIPVLTITRAEASFDPLTAYSYKGSVNSDTFYGAPTRTVRCIDFSGSNAYTQDGIEYWNVTYSFEFGFFPHGQGWDAVVLDEGLNYLNKTITDPTKQKQPITNHGVIATEPQKLDLNGQPERRNGYAWFRFFRTYPMANFGALNL